MAVARIGRGCTGRPGRSIAAEAPVDPPVDPPPTGDMDAYFTALSGLTSLFIANSLRTNADIQLSGADPFDSRGIYTYDPTQAALLMTWQKERININTKILSSETAIGRPNWTINDAVNEYVIIWHARFGSMWRPQDVGGGLSPRGTGGYTHKEFQVLFDRSDDPGHERIFYETREGIADGTGPGKTWQFPAILDPATDFGYYDNRLYSGVVESQDVMVNYPKGFAFDGRAPMNPTGRSTYTPVQTLPMRYDEWIRYIIRIKPNQQRTAFPEWETDNLPAGAQLDPDLYHMFSQWVQTARGITRVAYKVPVSRVIGLNTFDVLDSFLLEQNTSSSQIPPDAGSIVLTGTPGASIATNLQFTRDSDGARYQYKGPGALIEANGTVEITNIVGITGDQKGEGANCSPGMALTVVSPPAGVNTAATVGVQGISGGEYFINQHGKIWARDVIILQNYSSAAFSSSTPENDPVIFAAM